jgi:hypothetical protein
MGISRTAQDTKLAGISGVRRRDICTTKLMALATNINNKNIGDLYIGIN